jgi:hypothetical protein
MRALRVLWLAVSLTSLLAVAQEPATTAPQTTETKPAKATVYIYRYKQFVGSALAPSVFCDEVQLARMENGRYFAASIDPGKHTLRSNDQQSGLELEAKAGQEYFVRVEIAAGMMKGHGRLILMSPEQGRYELQSKKLKPLDEDKVVDRGQVSIKQVQLEVSGDAGELKK